MSCLLFVVAWDASAQCPPSFGAGVTYPTASEARDVSPGDFNNDGIVDLAVGLPAAVGVLFGNGDGTFDPVVMVPAGSAQVLSVAVGDFNEDGVDDLAATGTGIFVLISNGDGTFDPPVTYKPGQGISWIERGDIEGDGDVDLVFAQTSPSPSGVGTLLGNGDGTFVVSPVVFAPPTFPRHVATGDFNEDGRDDVIAAGFGGAVYLRSNGDGTYVPTLIGGSGAVIATAVGDVNGDGNLDVVGAEGLANQISVFLGSGTGTFGAPALFPAGNDVRFVALADFTRDGSVDVAALNAGAFSVLPGNGSGAFGAPATFPSIAGNSLAAGLFDANASPDVAIGGVGGVQIFLNQCVPAPSIATISPGSGPETGGTTVTITGANLGNATVTFGGLPATVVSNDGTTLVVTTPPHTPGTFAVVVTTPSGSATGSFTFVAAPPGPGQGIPTLGTMALLALVCGLAVVAAGALR
jgi:hypothetical protein